MNNLHEIAAQVHAAQKDLQAADELVRQYLPFIKSETAKFIRRIPLEGEDDELSIAMFAFYEAAISYQERRGTFLKFAQTAIRNRLIDFQRKEQRQMSSGSIDAPVCADEDAKTLSDLLPDQKNEIEQLQEQVSAKTEIEKFASELGQFDLSLSEIADSCPKQTRTLETCMKALEYAKVHPELLTQMLRSKKLPLAQLCEGAGLERKTLERHRKYLIAILLAYTNGFEIIRGHLRQMKRKEAAQS